MTMPVQHTLTGGTSGGNSQNAPSSAALTARAHLATVFRGDADVTNITALHQGDGSSSVILTVSSHSVATNVLTRIKALSGAYTYVQVQIGTSTTMVPVTLTETLATGRPAKSKDGKPLNNSVTADDCNWAAATLQQAMLPNKIAVTPDLAVAPSGLSTCFVQAMFPDDTSFLAFLSWPNPYTIGHELFFMDHIRTDGSVATVAIHALRSP